MPLRVCLNELPVSCSGSLHPSGSYRYSWIASRCDARKPCTRLWSAARDFAVAAAARARGRRRPGYVRGATFEKVMFPSLPDSPFSTLSHSPSAPPYVGTCAQAMCEDRIIVCPDVATDTRFDAGWRRLYLGCGLHSVQSAPVFGCNGKALGTFVMALREPGASFDREVTGFGVYAMRTILQNPSCYDHPGLRR